MSLFDFVKKDKEDIQFIDITPEENFAVYPHFPPMLAKDVKPVVKNYQENKYNKYNFPACPGMHDFSRIGYIIPAWSNFHIKANKAGCVAIAGSRGEDFDKRLTQVRQPLPMGTDLTEGLFEFQNGIQPCVWNFPGPWRIIASKNLSALILPAFYHSTFLEDLYVYPGVVDYESFPAINFIVSPKRKCEIEIKAGDPLFHVVPFYTNKTITASYGPGTKEKRHSVLFTKYFHESNFYRKYHMIKKKFKIFKKVE